MSATTLRQLDFRSEEDIARDVRALRAGERHDGQWSLPEACWHLSLPAVHCLHEPASRQPTTEQIAMQLKLSQILSARAMPAGLPIPPGGDPKSDAPAPLGPEAVNEFLASLDAMKQYRGAFVDFGPFGPVPYTQLREFVFIHAAHHLAHFAPTGATRRAGQRYFDEAACIADVEHLRRGYVRTGEWTLGQICWHLNYGIEQRMMSGPFAPNTPEQEARRELFATVLSTGKLPSGLVAPDAMRPPADAGDAAIDALIGSLKRFATFPGPFAPHRLFGHQPMDVAHAHTLIHCAHHLSYLVPTK